MKQIKSLNLKPEIVLLETVDFKDATETEDFYINLFKFYGFDLVNRRNSDYTYRHDTSWKDNWFLLYSMQREFDEMVSLFYKSGKTKYDNYLKQQNETNTK